MRDRYTPELLQAADRGEGFFYCGHCEHVVAMPPEVDPEPGQQLKCPRCRKWAVTFKLPAQPRRLVAVAAPRAKAVSVERGKELFEQIHQLLETV